MITTKKWKRENFTHSPGFEPWSPETYSQCATNELWWPLETGSKTAENSCLSIQNNWVDIGAKKVKRICGKELTNWQPWNSQPHLSTTQIKKQNLRRFFNICFMPSSLSWEYPCPSTPLIGVLLDESNCLLLIWGACSRSNWTNELVLVLVPI